MSLLAFLGSCDDGAAPVPPPDAAGRITIERREGAALLDAPARIMACARDTTVAVAAVGTHWAAGISVRLLLPIDSSLTLPVLQQLDRYRSAMIALRSLDDSLHGWTADRGTLRLEAGDSISGSFEATLRRDTVTMDLEGRFSGPRPVDRCP